MRIEIVTPAPRGSRLGNRITALRWAKRLRELGHKVELTTAWSARASDLVIALHAEKSADSVERCAREAPRTPIFVALTGTDVYGDISRSPLAGRSLRSARRIVALQPLAIERLPLDVRARARTILQSAPT